ncbi:MAG: 5'-3' exonuclease H3TH domain-containing protein [bacterium]|nr:5'-3' exonuclease H3TH domain-containing protein [bacterium]
MSNENPTKKVLLLDSHALLHRMYHAMAPLMGPNNEPVGSLYGMAKLFLKIFREQKPDYIAGCFDRPEKTFREESFPAYKAHRSKTDDDLIWQIKESRELFDVFKIKCFELPGFEADDLIGTLVERYKNAKNGTQFVIFSGDKDLLQLVDNDKVVVDLIRPKGEVKQYNEALVKEDFGLEPKQIIDLKGLTGDASDNIPGVAGIGPKSATPLLQEWGTVEGVFENLVIISPKIAKKLEGNEAIALQSKELATIKKDLPVFLDTLDDIRAIPLNKDELKKYFERFGFVSLIKELEAIST